MQCITSHGQFMMSPKQRTENNNQHAIGTCEKYEVMVKMRLGNRDQATKYVDQISNEFSMFTARTLKPLAKYMKYITNLQRKDP